MRIAYYSLAVFLPLNWVLFASGSSLKAADSANPIPVKVIREYVEAEQQVHYPQLKDTRIRFIVDDVDIPLSSRPHWASMLRSAKNRTYLVVIDSHREGDRKELLLAYQPFNAQTGIIGHELAHTVYYLDRSFFGIARDALCQLSSCRIRFERDTDRRNVEHGLGWQRYDHSLFLRTSFGADPDAPPNPNSAYTGPRELMELIEANPAYQSTLAKR